jgi:hypothetical protein
MSVLKGDISQVLSAVPWLLSFYLQCFSSFHFRRASCLMPSYFQLVRDVYMLTACKTARSSHRYLATLISVSVRLYLSG